MPASAPKPSRFLTCIYKGDLRRAIKGCTGHARPADENDGPDLAGLWAFQLGGEGEIHWVRKADLTFLATRKPKR